LDTRVERIQRDIEKLSKYTSTPGAGTTRLSFSTEDRGAREYIKSEMVNAGLKVYEDAAATLIGRIDGEDNHAPVVMIGSHFDSVKNGGNFDGQAGVVAALEIARIFHDKKLKPKCPVEFVAMIGEEGSRFGGGIFASRAMAGKVNKNELYSFKDENGITIAEAMKQFGFDADKIEEAIRPKDNIKAFIELHIEQGPILESLNKEIGVVDYIVGLYAIEVKIEGRADHAGTTPMDMRVDALETAAIIISRVGDFTRELGEGTVATVGKLSVLPGSTNVVPNEVIFTVDIRSKYDSHIRTVSCWINEELEKLSESKGVKFSVLDNLDLPPVKLTENIVDIIEKNSEKLGFSNMKILSGAGHDAMVMADITDVGMIFVPSKNGRSHSPQEWTEYDQLQKGVEVAYETIKELSEVNLL
jgi:allantoate deiminase